MPEGESAVPALYTARMAAADAAPEMERGSCPAAAREPEPRGKEDPLHCKSAFNWLQGLDVNHLFHWADG